MLLLVNFLILVLAEVRLCALPHDVQSIKLKEQILNSENVLRNYFSYVPEDPVSENDGFDIFMLLDGKEILGYVKCLKASGYSSRERKEYAMISMYSFTVPEKYQGQGLSNRLLTDTLEYMKKRYKLAPDTLITLHLSPKDAKMPIAGRIYYSFGLTRGLFIKSDPRELAHSLDRLFDASRDMLDVINGKETGDGDGHYFMLFCKLKDFGKKKGRKAITIEDTTKLFNILKERKEKNERRG